MPVKYRMSSINGTNCVLSEPSGETEIITADITEAIMTGVRLTVSPHRKSAIKSCAFDTGSAMIMSVSVLLCR